ncbi:GGDEF domain-containing phosphodiesterase [Blastococcus sp. CT_GayMR16]|uniref:putative bifunctional diguanylate cyclase/phosphodiesterase n=1 Tax=Blastococcus sp. CT_GayMR16 TaxID=2559607 RepID=UPI0010742B40|nr:GGDEF domain-containing phosphodiesterase [Blastococcus sp. CT_GayMR16]TFV89088.1 phosphodiesterase [Blastococcus sp. CT_GayMR16]
MDPRRWWLLVCAVPVLVACAVAASNPALRVLGDLAVSTGGLLVAVLILAYAGRTTRPRAWRLMAIAPLFPVAGAISAAIVGTHEPVQLAVLRWIPTVPGYLISILALLAMVDRARLRTGPRLAAEVALFLGACLVVMQLLVVGPAGRWTGLELDEKLILAAAVLATSATMAAALTVLGVIETGRRPMALVLLTAAAFLTMGRGLGTSAMLSGAAVPLDAARFLICAGLFLLGWAALLDGQPSAPQTDRPARSLADVGQLLPHVALLVAVVTCGSVALTGVRPSPGTIVGLVACVTLAAVHRWLTAREEQQMGARLRRSEAHFRSLVQTAGDAVVILDDDLCITWSSPALQRSLGPEADALLGRPLLAAVHPDDIAALAAVLPTSGAESAPVPADAGLLTLRLADASGEWRYLEAGVSDLRGDADVAGVVLHCRDMTDRHAREQALQSVAFTDPMTGLPNRAGFLGLVRQTLADAADPSMTLLVIELDGLAAARENAGREIVSTVVAEVGRRLRATVRGEDTVARMGGGAFAVLTEGTDADADRLAARCLSVVEQPILTTAGIIDLTAGVGVVPLEEGLGVEGLLARGDLAVRAAHEAGAGSARRYSAALGDAAVRRDRLRRDLQGAQSRDELFLLFQPIVSLEQQRITGMEAQLRWMHPELGEVPSAEFLALAERAGLIGELMRWAVEESARAAAGLPEREDPLRIGVKIPFGYLATGAVVTDVDQALRRSGLAPERLVLQINAPAVTSDDERTGLDVASLRLMGVHVALDGFGSGSSALAHLTRLPIDVLRLDRSLISRIDRDPQSRALCESIVGIGRALGVDVVADGVETPAQLAALCGFGCGFAQGFLISRPLSLAGFTAMFAETEGSLWPGLVGSSSR